MDKKEVMTEDPMTGTSTEGMTATTQWMMMTVTAGMGQEQAIEAHLHIQK